jgi:hypothetical protein
MVTLSNGHDLSPRFVKSCKELEVYDREFALHAWEAMGGPESPTPLDLRLLTGDGFVESSANVSNQRNKAVRGFLEEQDEEWLWFVDGDQVFAPDTLHKLAVTAHRNDIKIMGAVIPIITTAGLIGNCFTVDEDEATTHVIVDPLNEKLGEPGPKEFAATGCGCLLIHRDVLESMHKDEGDHLGYFYEDRPRAADGERRWTGEDVSFCLRARKLGFTVVVDTSVHVGHHKDVRTWWPTDIAAHAADPNDLTPQHGKLDDTPPMVKPEVLAY